MRQKPGQNLNGGAAHGDSTQTKHRKGEGGGIESAVSTTEPIAGNMSPAVEQAQALTNAIETIPGAKTVKITLTADDPQGNCTATSRQYQMSIYAK